MIATVDELKEYLNMAKQVAFAIYCDATDATAATIKITGNKMYLIITGGAAASSHTIDLTSPSYNKIEELVDYIHALNGWWCYRYAGTGINSVLLEGTPLTSVLGVSELMYIGTTSNQFNATRMNSLLNNILNSVTVVAEGEMKRSLTLESVTEYYDGPGTPILILKNYPVISITSIHMDANRTFDSTTLVDGINYYSQLASGRIELLGGLVWTRGQKNIQVIYTRGWASIPLDLKQAGLELAAIKWKESQAGEGRIGVLQVTTKFSDVESRTEMFVRDRIPKSILGVFQRYRKISTFF
jgi:hypothetical protein